MTHPRRNLAGLVAGTAALALGYGIVGLSWDLPDCGFAWESCEGEDVSDGSTLGVFVGLVLITAAPFVAAAFVAPGVRALGRGALALLVGVVTHEAWEKLDSGEDAVAAPVTLAVGLGALVILGKAPPARRAARIAAVAVVVAIALGAGSSQGAVVAASALGVLCALAAVEAAATRSRA